MFWPLAEDRHSEERGTNDDVSPMAMGKRRRHHGLLAKRLLDYSFGDPKRHRHPVPSQGCDNGDAFLGIHHDIGLGWMLDVEAMPAGLEPQLGKIEEPLNRVEESDSASKACRRVRWRCRTRATPLSTGHLCHLAKPSPNAEPDVIGKLRFER